MNIICIIIKTNYFSVEGEVMGKKKKALVVLGTVLEKLKFNCL